MSRSRTALALLLGLSAVGACAKPVPAPAPPTATSPAPPLPPAAPGTVRLGDLDLKLGEQAHRRPLANRSREDKPITLGGRVYPSGVGTESFSTLVLDLHGTASRFTADVGVDDEKKGTAASVEFQLIADGKPLWSSGILRAGAPATAVDVPLTGVRTLYLVVTDGGDGGTDDHADWAGATFSFSGERPVLIARPLGTPYILTPPAAPQPRINSARLFGVRPGSPVLYTIAATGEAPVVFAAERLPRGLRLDPHTGQITGAVAKAGTYDIILRATNKRGRATRALRLVVGDRIALTPPMGWNSWNCFGGAVTADKVKAAADAMVKSGLAQHGWQYINIDDFWEVHRDSKDPTLQGPQRDPGGKVLPNPRFPDMNALVDYIHGLGLKAGLYSSPGPWTCGGCVGSYQHEEQDAASYAAWGFDYLKYDWCSYGKIAKDKELATLQAPYITMRDALRAQKRDIVYSLCQYGNGDVWKWGDDVGGNVWRTTGDINDTWARMASIGFSQAGHEAFAGPGHFNDPDMLVVGQVGWGKNLHPTRLTADEQYTHISLWALLAAPLLIGADMTQLDDFTKSLLTNDEVIDVDQDPLGRQAGRVLVHGEQEVWGKELEDGSRAVGLFNRSYLPARVEVSWSDLGLDGEQAVRDLWRQKDLGRVRGGWGADLPPHGAALIRVSPPAPGKGKRAPAK